jgi:DnaJ-domain-containing protein 1
MNWTSQTLYKEAYRLHYEEYEFDQAEQLYVELVKRFPLAQESSWAKSQIKNIQEMTPAKKERTKQRHENKETKKEDRRSGAQGGNSEQTPKEATATIPCYKCKKLIRLHLPARADIFRCPACRTEYHLFPSQESPLVAVAVPIIENESKSTPQPRKMSLKVREAFTVMNMAPDSSIVDVRTSYLDLINQYHPDKVSHLGYELRKLAEEKTKEIIAAFDILKKWFAEQ